MKYHNIVEATFVARPNRFIADCKIKNDYVKVHVKNTGKCKELLIPGVKVYLEYHNNPSRKTNYSLITVLKGNRLINMDSQVPNKVFYEGIRENKIVLPGLEGEILKLKPEVVYGNSRFDAFIETTKEKVFVEVKGVTLEEENIVLFPDAKTERGVKHIHELIKAKEEGYKSYLVFIIQMKGVEYFTPHQKMHREFADALRFAEEKGVEIMAYDSYIAVDEIKIGEKVKIKL